MENELLLRKAKKGESKSFEKLVAPHEQMIWRLCFHMMGNEADAKDALQETMFKAWRSIVSYRGESGFGTWLYRVGVSCCLDALRKKRIRETESVDALREKGLDFPDHSLGQSEILERKEEMETLGQAVAALPEEQRIPLMLSVLEEKTYEEIADLLQVPVGTVRSRIARARIAIKKKMMEYGNYSFPNASDTMKGGRQS